MNNVCHISSGNLFCGSKICRENGSACNLRSNRLLLPRKVGALWLIATGALILAVLMPLTASSAQSATTDANRFLWNQANAGMASAEKPDDYARAAELYRQLLERGVHNPPLYYNYGTALLFAEAPEAAADALLRAERHGGTTADLRRNLALALAAQHDNDHEGPGEAPDSLLSWTRVPLFWHYQIPLRNRIWIVVVLHFVLWLAFILRMGGMKDTARGLAVVSVAGLMLFGSSVLVSLHQDTAPLPHPEYRWQSSLEAES